MKYDTNRNIGERDSRVSGIERYFGCEGLYRICVSENDLRSRDIAALGSREPILLEIRINSVVGKDAGAKDSRSY